MQLPLLTYTSTLYPDTDFSDTLVIACQHILGTTLNLFEELFSRNLQPENLHVIGKCYSTNLETLKLMQSRGIHVSSHSTSYNSVIPFDEQFQEYIQTFLEELLSSIRLSEYKQVIILDDGGYLLAYANDFLKDVANVVGIEQTSSGYEKIKDLSLRFPVINVARSTSKLNAEAELIADLVTTRIHEYITKHSISEPRILVVGQGSIGSRIKTRLQKTYTISGCDVITERCDFNGNYRDHLSEFNVIVGTTGTEIIAPGEFSTLRANTHLISVSSSDREFSGAYLRQTLALHTDCHADIVANGIHLANSGFPINFDGAVHSLPPEHAQLTRALLLMALYESLSANASKELVELSDNQGHVVAEFERLTV